MANVPTIKGAHGTLVPKEQLEISPSGKNRNLNPPASAFDSIAPGVSLPAVAVPAVQVPQEHHAPGEWFAAILIHSCYDPVQVLCEAYPSEPEAEAAAMRMRQKYFKGQDSRTFGSISGCAIELFVTPTYLHGIEATNRVFSLGHGS